MKYSGKYNLYTIDEKFRDATSFARRHEQHETECRSNRTID